MGEDRPGSGAQAGGPGDHLVEFAIDAVEAVILPSKPRAQKIEDLGVVGHGGFTQRSTSASVIRKSTRSMLRAGRLIASPLKSRARGSRRWLFTNR